MALLLLGVAGALGWHLALRWHQRAETAENEYRVLEDALSSSTSDVSSLEERQRQLAQEKAALEDEQVLLERQQEELESQQAELAETLTTVSRIANEYSACSSGYGEVIADLAAGAVTAETQGTAVAADAACARGNELARTLP